MNTFRKTVFLSATLIALALLVSGCSTRSISDSGYRGEYGRSDNPLYKGELSEFDVLGVNAKESISQEDIEKALAAKQRVTLPKGSSIMLIQSGAMIPDETMLKAFEKRFDVSPFSGVPQDKAVSGYSMALRLAAAKGGHEKIVCVWGQLETARKNLATKIVSWTPIVGGVIPDESQQMRIRLKIALVDVKSGQWDMLAPEPYQDDAISAGITRESSDQGQVAMLKAKAYQAAADELARRYAK